MIFLIIPPCKLLFIVQSQQGLTRMTDFGGLGEVRAQFVTQKKVEEMQPTMGGGFFPSPHA